jgi:hypothetical protein
MDKLDFLIDGVKVRYTDLNQFKTENQLNDWRDRVKTIIETMTESVDISSDNLRFDALEELYDFIQPRRDAILAEAEARKLNMPARNLDFRVTHRAEWSKYSPTFNDIMVANVGLLLDCFDDAEDMTSFEFDAYETMGPEELDRQGIETLHDMFGTEWAEAFYKRKNHLITKHDLEDLYRERAKLNAEIEKLEAPL